ncbi:MAG: hypothetical protein LAT65_06675 [Saccharospirillum sp.]|nr:hypothetical protein [Saccharospirillum sp.]
MREGLMDAWRQRAIAQQYSPKELSAQSLVGFLTLLLIVVVVYWSVSLDSTTGLDRLQRLSAQAFNLQATPSKELESVTHGRHFDSLEGVDGIRIHFTESTLSVLIENDVLFFPGSADTRESAVHWWQRLVQGLAELNRPLKLVYFQQWEGQSPDHADRRILVEQATTLSRLFTAEQLTIEQLDIVDTWINPYFEGNGVDDDESSAADAVLLMIEVLLESPEAE